MSHFVHCRGIKWCTIRWWHTKGKNGKRVENHHGNHYRPNYTVVIFNCYLGISFTAKGLYIYVHVCVCPPMLKRVDKELCRELTLQSICSGKRACTTQLDWIFGLEISNLLTNAGSNMSWNTHKGGQDWQIRWLHFSHIITPHTHTIFHGWCQWWLHNDFP